MSQNGFPEGVLREIWATKLKGGRFLNGKPSRRAIRKLGTANPSRVEPEIICKVLHEPREDWKKKKKAGGDKLSVLKNDSTLDQDIRDSRLGLDA